MDKEEGKAHTLFHENVCIGLVIILSPLILRAGCNEVESNIVNFRICVVVRREWKEGRKKNTIWENSRDR